MKKATYAHVLRSFLIVSALAIPFIFVLACSSAAPTATPAPAPKATATSVAPTAPTSVPTATRIAPTATPDKSKAPQYGGVLTFPITQSVDSPDPAFSTGSGTKRMLYLIFNGLTQQTPAGVISPDLARSWEVSQDGKSVTFQLQKGAKFHDGTPADAAAVKWNYDRYMDKAVGSSRGPELSPPLEKVEVIDDSTVRFSMSTPFRPLLATLSLQAGMIASPTAVQKANSYANRQGEFGRKPVGSGPFVLKEWLPGSYFTVVKNSTYWDTGKPYLDGMNLPIIGDKQIQFAMLRTGEADIMEEVPSESVPLAKANPKVVVIEQKGAGTQALFFRVSAAPFDNKALRQALAYAINKQAVVDTVFSGAAVVAHSIVAPSLGDWFDSTVKQYEFSTAKAKQKLTEAGYPNGFSFKMPCRTGGKDGQTCETLQAVLSQSGINMEIQLYENVAYFTDMASRKHNGPLAGNWSPRPDPGILLKILFYSKGSQNSWDYKNSDVDNYILEGDTVYDMAKAKELYHKALVQIADDAPIIFLAWWSTFYGYRDNVFNFAPVPDKDIRLRDLWLGK